MKEEKELLHRYFARSLHLPACIQLIQDASRKQLLESTASFSFLAKALLKGFSDDCSFSEERFPYQVPFPEQLLSSDLEKISLEQDPCALLGYALTNQYLCIEIPERTHVTVRIPPQGWSRIHYRIKENASLHLESISPSSAPSHTICTVELCDRAYFSSQYFYPKGAIFFASSDISVGEEASCLRYMCNLASLSSQRAQVCLEKKRSFARYVNLCISLPEAQQEEAYSIEHKAQEASSFLLNKAVVADKAFCSCRVRNRLLEPLTSSHSFIHALTLGKMSQMVARPAFEIFHDEVEAHHGCTTKEIDKEFLLYAQLRGLNRKIAQRVYLEGFCQEMVKGFSFTKEPLYDILSALFQTN